jgi:hypothetical protein
VQDRVRGDDAAKRDAVHLRDGVIEESQAERVGRSRRVPEERQRLLGVGCLGMPTPPGLELLGQDLAARRMRIYYQNTLSLEIDGRGRRSHPVG